MMLLRSFPVPEGWRFGWERTNFGSILAKLGPVKVTEFQGFSIFNCAGLYTSQSELLHNVWFLLDSWLLLKQQVAGVAGMAFAQIGLFHPTASNPRLERLPHGDLHLSHLPPV